MREIFVFVSIGIDLNEIEIYDKPQKIIKPNEQYNIFIFPNNQMNNNFSNIYISNTNYLSKTICYKKIYGNIDYIFSFTNGTCVEIEENKNISILFDRPKEVKINDEQTYILIFIDNPVGFILDYDFYEYSKLENYQNDILLFDENKKFKLYYFNNQEKGDIYIQFNKKMKDNTQIYVYNSKELIHKNQNGFDGNIIIKDNINELNQYTFSSDDKDLYIILYNINGIEKNNIIIFSSNIFYIVPLKSNIILYTNNNKKQELNYIIESSRDGYLHLQWIIENKNSKGKFTIYNNNIEDAIYISDSKDKNSDFIYLKKNNYKIKFEINNEPISK